LVVGYCGGYVGGTDWAAQRAANAPIAAQVIAAIATQTLKEV
jgi:hypothetical protein